MKVDDSQIRSDQRRPYVRPMTGWWRSNPFFMRYMVRELTALFVGAYALLLLVGLVCLTLGAPAWQAWRNAVGSAPGLVFNLASLLALIHHAWTWFEIMPKTMAPMVINGERLSAERIQRTGWSVAAVAFVVALLLAVWSQS